MQRLEIVWLGSLIYGNAAPSADVASYWEINVKSCGEERYYDVVGYGPGGESAAEHVFPYSLVRSVSARPIPEERIEEKEGSK